MIAAVVAGCKRLFGRSARARLMSVRTEAASQQNGHSYIRVTEQNDHEQTEDGHGRERLRRTNCEANNQRQWHKKSRHQKRRAEHETSDFSFRAPAYPPGGPNGEHSVRQAAVQQ